MARTNKQNSISIPKPELHVEKNSNILLTPTDTKKVMESLGETIRFSFQFFDRTHEHFNLGGINQNWFVGLFERLQDLSRVTVQEFKNPRTQKGLRIHSHDWDIIDSKLTHIPDDYLKQFKDGDPVYQFQLSKATGRVHGFRIENTFYIVWFDPHHNLYPMSKHGGIKTYPILKTEYEILEEEYEKCIKDKEELNQYLEELTKPN